MRERLKAGDSDSQVMRFIEDRYGEFVLLRPPLNTQTLLLWLAPLLVLLAAAVGGAALLRQRAVAGHAGARRSRGAEEDRLRALLAEQQKGEHPSSRKSN